MRFVKLFESELPGNHSLQKGFDELQKLAKSNRIIKDLLEEYFDVLADIAVKTENTFYFIEEVPTKVIGKIKVSSKDKDPYLRSLFNLLSLCGAVFGASEFQDFEPYDDYDLYGTLENRVLQMIQSSLDELQHISRKL